MEALSEIRRSVDRLDGKVAYIEVTIADMKVSDCKRTSSDLEIAKLLGTLANSVQSASDKVDSLELTVSRYLDGFDSRLEDLRSHLLSNCAIRHTKVSEEIQSVVSKEVEVAKKIEDIVVRGMQAEITDARLASSSILKSKDKAEDSKTYWRRYGVIVLVSVLMLILGASFQYLLNKVAWQVTLISPNRSLQQQ